MADVSVESLGV